MNKPLTRKKLKEFNILLLLVIVLLVITIYKQSDFKTIIRTQAQEVPDPVLEQVQISIDLIKDQPKTAVTPKMPTQKEFDNQVKITIENEVGLAMQYLHQTTGDLDITVPRLIEGDAYAVLTRWKEDLEQDNEPLLIPYKWELKNGVVVDRFIDLNNFGKIGSQDTIKAIRLYTTEFALILKFTGWESRMWREHTNTGHVTNKKEMLAIIKHDILNSQALRHHLNIAEADIQNADMYGVADAYERERMRGWIWNSLVSENLVKDGTKVGLVPRLANKIYAEMYARIELEKTDAEQKRDGTYFTPNDYVRDINSMIWERITLSQFYPGKSDPNATRGVDRRDYLPHYRYSEFYEKYLKDMKIWVPRYKDGNPLTLDVLTRIYSPPK